MGMEINQIKKKRNKKKSFNRCLPLIKPPVEDFIVNAKEHNVLKKFWKKWEKQFNVQIRMPKTKSLDSDVIFVSIQGEEANRSYVKKFLAEKMRESTHIDIELNDEDSVDLITLSESEEESIDSSGNPLIVQEKESSDMSKREKESHDISVIDLDLDDTVKIEQEDIFKGSCDVSVCILDDPTSPSNLQTIKNVVTKEPQDVSICIIDDSTSTLNLPIVKNFVSEQKKGKKRKHDKMKVSSENVSSSEALDSYKVSNTTENDMVTKKPNLSESVLIIGEPSTSSKPILDFIPLTPEANSVNKKIKNKNSCSKSVNSNEIDNEEILIIDENECTVATRHLRPVVIDGSNIAMEHGKTTRSFSVKGIKLAIDYFLNRGHTQVTAFVPKFRRSRNPNRTVPTTDVELFDELERKQQVVFTPSRCVNGKFISSYDDRFIVQLASSNGGVIVSNDNYRDLINDSRSFKEAIEKRLLMFCFVGDMFMVPDDPLGRNGPSLNDFLSFPPDVKEKDKE